MASLPGRSSVAQSLGPALALVGVLALVLGCKVIALALTARTADPLWAAVLFVVVAWVYVVAGLLAWWRRPSNRMGAVIVAGGVALLAGALDVTGVRVLVAASMVLGTLSLAVAVHLLHAFPSGRLEPGLSRGTVVAGYVVSVVLQAPAYLFTVHPSPFDLLAVADRPDLASLGREVQAAAGTAVMIATGVVLVGRLRRADRPQRRVLVPVYAYGIIAVVFLPLSANVLRPLLGLAPGHVIAMQLIALAGIPLAFVLGVLRGGFARTGEIEELGAWLGTVGGERPALADALVRTLGDESLRLLFWVPDGGGYVDATGRPAHLPATGSGRAAVEVELRDRRVGAIIYDATLIADPELVRAAGRVVAMAVDRERLTAQLRASEEALRRSRARIVETGDRERRRLARNLHDGLQVRLVLLALQAQQFADDPDMAATTRPPATALRDGIDAAAAELRQLVHAVMPAALIERGLCAATEDLVDRMPVPTQLELAVPDGTLSTAVESTAYFVVAEGLANALKYAHARELAVRLVLAEQLLSIEVRDDGVGGASIADGTGLRGLLDRVDTLGGRMRVQSPRGHGTQLMAELPCGS